MGTVEATDVVNGKQRLREAALNHANCMQFKVAPTVHFDWVEFEFKKGYEIECISILRL